MASAQIKHVGGVIQVIITADNGEETTLSMVEHEAVRQDVSDDITIITVTGIQRTYLKGNKNDRKCKSAKV